MNRLQATPLVSGEPILNSYCPTTRRTGSSLSKNKLYSERMCKQIAGRLQRLHAILPSNQSARQCWYCGKSLARYKHLKVFCTPLRYPFLQTRDHIRPLSRGGAKGTSNRVFACLRCNHQKANRTLEEYREHLGQVAPFFGETSVD